MNRVLFKHIFNRTQKDSRAVGVQEQLRRRRVGGAHELYSGTFKWKHKLKTLVRLGFAYRNANDGYRSEETLNKILSVENELVTIPCTQGSILFSDTSHLHRSGPCIYPHNRYSVTFYTWKSSIPDHVLPWISKG